MIRVRTYLEGWPGAPGLNTFYWFENAADPETVALEAFSAVHEFWTVVAGMEPVGFTATVDQTVDEISSGSGDFISSYFAPGPNVLPGTVADEDFLPAQTMAHITLRTNGVGPSGRRIRGGSYIGPLHEGCNGSNGQMTPAAQLQLASAANDNLFPTLPSGALLCVWQRPTALASGNVHPVVDLMVRPVWAALKSRRR